jgi:hypothetical protein
MQGGYMKVGHRLLAVAGVLVAMLPLCVVAEPGQGIGGVEVGMRKKPGGQLVANTRTDQQGNFTFANLAAGDYAIMYGVPAVPANPTAKSFFESRSNTARVEVNVRPAKGGGPPPRTASWTPATNTLVTANASNARSAAAPGEMVIAVAAGDTVTGRVTEQAPAAAAPGGRPGPAAVAPPVQKQSAPAGGSVANPTASPIQTPVQKRP